jgi:hypothetical protein
VFVGQIRQVAGRRMRAAERRQGAGEGWWAVLWELPSMLDMCLVWVKQCHKPPMTGNGKYSTYKNGDDSGMVYGIVLPTLLLFICHEYIY